MARLLRHVFLAPATCRLCRRWGFCWVRLTIAGCRGNKCSLQRIPALSLHNSQRAVEISVLPNDVRIPKSSVTSAPGVSREIVSSDTIVAIVTSLGGSDGAVAIVRLSGSSAVAITARLFCPARKLGRFALPDPSAWQPRSHRVEYGTLRDSSGALIDEVLVVPMLAPRSYTKEDVVELQCHGGDICVQRVLQICLEAGARLAKPGEFTLRAFLNGRLDLAQAENVAQLISAKTSVGAETALAGIQGGLSSLVRSLRNQCLELLGDIEARLDFEDEVPCLDTTLVVRRIDFIWQCLQDALATAARGKLLESGLQVAIVGRPNVGKSSLLNAWSQSERAIVTNIPGTTRDIVEATVIVGGISVKLLDTAGICDTVDIVEGIGVQRSKAAAAGSDVVIMVISAYEGWTPQDDAIFRLLWESDALQTPSVLVVNKVDEASAASVMLPKDVMKTFSKVIPTCALQHVGLSMLEAALLNMVGMGEVRSEGRQWAVNQRQAEQLVRASEALLQVKDSVQQDLPLDMWSVDMKEAVIALGQISGDNVTEELLSNIFSRFCIGK